MRQCFGAVSLAHAVVEKLSRDSGVMGRHALRGAKEALWDRLRGHGWACKLRVI